MSDGYFNAQVNKSRPQWTLITMNYIGPEEGIRIYQDGQEVADRRVKIVFRNQPGDGNLVAGRRFTNWDIYYAIIKLDELLFLNNILQANEVKEMYDL